MEVTNNFELPEFLADALTEEREPWDNSSDEIRVTTLIRPPQMVRLEQTYWDRLQADITDYFYASLGTAWHKYLENQNQRGLTEIECVAQIPGEATNLVGHLDHYDPNTETLTDHKVTSVWSIVYGGNSDWVTQLNIYAWLLGKHRKYPVRKLQICYALRDWQESKSHEPNYPDAPMGTLHLPLWQFHETEDLIQRLYAAHLASDPRPCTRDETWTKDDTFAVMKQGRKRAIKVFEGEAGATQWLEEQPDKAVMWIQHRPGLPRRCEKYCPVSAFCGQYRALIAEPEGAEA